MKRTCLFSFFALFLLLSACNRNLVRVEHFTPSGQVDEFTTFEIMFSKDLAPQEKLNEWLDDEFATFDPPIRGKFKWVSPNSLLFSPENALKPGTDYKVEITDKVLFGAKLSTKFETYTFHTAYFDATKVDFFWSRVPRSDFKVSAKVNLYFNYDVDPKLLKDYLIIEKEGKEFTNYTIETEDHAPVIAIDLGQQQQTEKDLKFKLRVKSGMKCLVTDRPMEDERAFDLLLPPITRLTITGTSTGFNDNNAGWIVVHTTQEVDQAMLTKFVSLDPSKNVTFSTSENSFRMDGTFSPGDKFDLTVKKGLPGLYGGTLENEFTEEIVLADLSPSLEFSDDKGKYMMRSGLKNLSVKAVNVPEVEVEIHEVFANNLLFFLYQNGNGYYYDDYYGDYYEDYYYDYDNDNHSVGNFGKLLHRDTVRLGNLKNYRYDFTVNVEKHLDKRFRGIYVVKVRDFDDYWRRDSKVIAVSDIGMIARKSRDQLNVYINAIGTAQPMPETEVLLISSNNQTLMKGTTDAQGMVTFNDVQAQTEGFQPRLIVAVKGDDYNFIDLRETSIETSRFEVGGKDEVSEVYDTYIYADRNLYRPGETANISAIVRTKDITPVTDIPVLLKIISPQGRVFKTYNKKLNAQGSFEQDVKLPDALQTGEYVAEVYSGNKDLMASYRFSVEEFVPDKIRVMLDGDKEALKPGESLNLNIMGEYLFGAPAAGHACEIDVRLNHTPFYSKKYPDFNFHNSSVSNQYVDNETFSEVLDEKGKFNFAYTMPSGIRAGGLLSGTVYVSVFDATGRTVNRSYGFKGLARDSYLGIKSPRYYYGTGEVLEFPIAAVDGMDNDLKNFPVEVEVIRRNWKSVLVKQSGYWRYESQREEEVAMPRRKQSVSGKGSFSFKAERSGDYEIRLYKQGSSEYVSQSFYCYGWGGTTATSFEVNKEGRIEMVFDKKTYEPGETAKVLFTTPFSGQMLVTFEQNKVLESRYLTVENNSAELQIPITDAHLPNFYVTATLFRPHDGSNNTPFLVGHGFESVGVEKKSNKLAVEIVAPEKIKPRTTQEVVVKTTAGQDVHVTLALVDEGILQIKGFKSPDPYAYMYAKRALRVNSYDMYELLLPEISAAKSSPAGGDEMGSGKRANPITAQRFKLLSYWSGIRKSDGNGEVRLQVPIPQFNGEARLMAVAYTGPRFGSASKPMKISDDVVMMPAIPRVLSVTDSIALPVSLMNTTSKSGEIKVSLKVEGPLKVTSKATQSIKLDGKSTGSVSFGVEAMNAAGKGKIILQASGLDNVTQDIEIAVRPVSPLVTETGSGTLVAGKEVAVQIPGGYIPASQHTRITISRFPGVKLAKHLKDVVGYPYGCLEQTTSKAFPQLYFEDLAAAVAPDKFFAGNPVYFVNEAITKIQSMIRNDGAFNYWPNGGYYNWWASVYATHFLVEAKKAGYNVNDNTLSTALGFVSRQAASKQTFNYSFYRNNVWVTEVKASKETIYSLYILALAGKGDLSTCNYYRAHQHLLTNDTRYLLAGAFALQGDWNAFHEIVPNAFTPEKAARLSGGSYDSEIRSNAIILSVLMDVDPKNTQIPLLVKYLSNLDESHWYSTQDKCWGFMALGKAAKKSASADMKVDIQVAGKSVGNYAGGNYQLTSDLLNGKTVTLKPTGTGEIYYFWNTEGIKDGAEYVVKEADHMVSVRRTFYDREGKAIIGDNFRQGDLVVCKISVTTGNRSVDNVAITDMIPAGFEIENPRLTTSTSLNWLQNTLYPEYMDVKDDRMLLFTNLYNSTSRDFYYMLRVVTAGKFKLPVIGAEAMYDPEFNSFHGARVITVSPKVNGGI
ncbi:MAG: alpha-2-macroglobulin family protein [Bacteroidia bacterium]|nr:alpha-2-macroglobulin family protein [Bacteroidia bacterium]